MTIRKLNCFSANTGWPLYWKTGTIALFFETNQDLTMVDCADEYRRLKESVGAFTQLCAVLASFGIPPTIHHDDFLTGMYSSKMNG
jgi:hypothetical protein